MLDSFDDIAIDEKRVMHMWNSFVSRQRSVHPQYFLLISAITVIEVISLPAIPSPIFLLVSAITVNRSDFTSCY